MQKKKNMYANTKKKRRRKEKKEKNKKIKARVEAYLYKKV